MRNKNINTVLNIFRLSSAGYNLGHRQEEKFSGKKIFRMFLMIF